ncbi:unnamed protein product, partial [Closterium sp. NIES-54]
MVSWATGAAGFTASTPLQPPPFSQNSLSHPSASLPPLPRLPPLPPPPPPPTAACAAVGKRGGEAAADYSHPPPPYPPPHCFTRSRGMEEKGGRGRRCRSCA